MVASPRRILILPLGEVMSMKGRASTMPKRNIPPDVFQPLGTSIEKAFSRVSRTVSQSGCPAWAREIMKKLTNAVFFTLDLRLTLRQGRGKALIGGSFGGRRSNWLKICCCYWMTAGRAVDEGGRCKRSFFG